MSSKNSCPPRISEYDPIWKYRFCKFHEVETGLTQCLLFLQEEENVDTETQEEHHVIPEVEIGVSLPPAKERQGLLASSRRQEKGTKKYVFQHSLICCQNKEH